MPSEPTPTDIGICDAGHDAIAGGLSAAQCPSCAATRRAILRGERVGGAAPSAPTRADRAFDIARQVVQAETAAPALFYCLDCQTRHPLGTEFCAPSAPTTDAHMIHGLERCIAAAHRLLDEHHDATVADRQDAEDAARLLAVLRGGATAPTPDPTEVAASNYNQGIEDAAFEAERMGWPGVAAAIRLYKLARLRGDTGASHE